MSRTLLSRRGLIVSGTALGGLWLAGCDRLSQAPEAAKFLDRDDQLNMSAQRLLLAGQPLAREFKTSEISRVFKANGSIAPQDPAYLALVQSRFANWALTVTGLVQRPLALSLAQLRALPARTQTTRHDCVEGWSAIGQWTGPQLSGLLRTAGLQPHARYVVFHCADTLGDSRYYESIDLFDAFHPQTILAHTMNGQPLAVAHGAPIRLRVERQLGYKQAKYVMGIEVTNSLDHIEGGGGGYWEDRGYEWYAGI
ncbi:molybdopterin-dependent oxidoreductase [Phenylobacterium sp.]|uniref:molybdopterin-dependent oxidoreductase n=1 Tax=Phenylobacterium sp. TaxID=1871053 RepID=UPI00120CAD96|nr:molybdopterin-dependent oxidoreductase [Phenylobacterium sp.]THD58120.1 MAG: molybdopterin-binding protein [Phenylobacterium sp.]